MKSYAEFLTESVSTYNEIRSLGKDKLNDVVDSKEPLTYHHVRGILDNKHSGAIDAIKRLAQRSNTIDSKGNGLLSMHAMAEKDDYLRNQHAYHLVNSGKLSDTQLKHVASHALKNNQTGMFDDHLAKKINSVSSNKDDVSSHINALKGD